MRKIYVDSVENGMVQAQLITESWEDVRVCVRRELEEFRSDAITITYPPGAFDDMEYVNPLKASLERILQAQREQQDENES